LPVVATPADTESNVPFRAGIVKAINTLAKVACFGQRS